MNPSESERDKLNERRALGFHDNGFRSKITQDDPRNLSPSQKPASEDKTVPKQENSLALD